MDVGAGKSFLRAQAATRNGVSNAGKELGRGHKCEERDPFCAVEIHARAYVGRCMLRFSATRPLRPIRDDRKRNTAEFPVPRTNASRRAVAVVCSKGDLKTGVTDRKNSFFLAAKEQKAESRGGTARRGAPRPARKNIIYVRSNGRPIARRFKPHEPRTLLLFPVLPDI